LELGESQIQAIAPSNILPQILPYSCNDEPRLDFASGQRGGSREKTVRRAVFDPPVFGSFDMAEDANSGSNNVLYFIVGAMVVVLAGLTFMFFNGNFGGRSKVDVTIQAPKTP
jgi:hypothetical protein